ncbi:transcription initiation factor TFIID subunit 3 [Kluyveromyces marxianus]|uniref:Transcription initiation factor TFIID subunit 3 n=1 Tax=Kluyveromyces marxianus (strain DMKU3-1042 / BCC 29191 / NBRC 104275) TaxID=1003335 RepID=W0TBH3_KLUMD|nr:transcription initiation factor TFIID subunit 3 [Kluyveromyces marxianus DMKU3-1042]BAO40353.1 transcription initiation factor TFIID subunit 3 [Kluyveromyces marxianus DMKU3-1042]BAP71841.1 transcription initiation factor TFIID subunit 3 [Kluyveromyces marxianus]
MTSDEKFYFSLLRISMIQLLRAHGFDKAKSSTIDLFTDLYIRYLELAIHEIRKLALDRGDLDEEVALQDITQGLLNIGAFKPTNLLDTYDEHPFAPGDEGMQKFKRWLLEDPATTEARVICTPTPDLLKMSEKSNKPLTMIPEYINQLNVSEKKPTDGDDEVELIEAMINNGDMDDWISFTVAAQRIELAKRKTGKVPKDTTSLPSIPGFKYSKLGGTRSTGNNSCIPVGVEIPEENEGEEVVHDSAQHELLTKLLSKLPVGNPENKLENITVSYEEDIDEEMELPPVENMDQDAELVDIEKQNFEFDSPGPGGLTLGNIDTKDLDEMEDMQNTFERRTSLDYGHSYDI